MHIAYCYIAVLLKRGDLLRELIKNGRLEHGVPSLLKNSLLSGDGADLRVPALVDLTSPICVSLNFDDEILNPISWRSLRASQTE